MEQIYIYCAIAIVVIIILRGITTVKQSTVKIVEFLGKYQSTLNPGIHYIVPILSRVRATIDMRETICDFPAQTIITKDNVQCKIDGIGFFRIVSASKAIYEVGDYYESISQLMQTHLRNIFGTVTLDEAQTSRDTISSTVVNDLNQITRQWGITITNIEIQSITPPQAIVDAMAMEMEAERKKRSLILASEGEKCAIIKKAEAQSQQMIIEAEAAKQRDILAAQAAATSERLSAEAQKAMMQELDKYLDDKEKVREYLVTMSYLETLASIGGGQNGKTIFMPFEASNLLSSMGILGQTTDLLRPKQ